MFYICRRVSRPLFTYSNYVTRRFTIAEPSRASAATTLLPLLASRRLGSYVLPRKKSPGWPPLPKSSRSRSRIKPTHKTRLVMTLDPTQLLQCKQPIIDLSGVRQPHIRCVNAGASTTITYHDPNTGSMVPFPEDTRGVLYYERPISDLPLSASLKFRICESATEEGFKAGRDLLLPDGQKPWKLRMARIADKHSRRTKPLLDLLEYDGLVVADEIQSVPLTIYVPYDRVIRTLDPSKLSLKQSVVDISGTQSPTFAVEDDSTCFRLTYDGIDYKPFPENSKGMFYFYRGSELRITESGIRFRLCDSPQSFEQGTDLLNTAGTPWCKNLVSLANASRRKNRFLKECLRSLRELLLREGLVEETVLEEISAQKRRKSSDPRVSVLYSLDQEFELDLGVRSFTIWLVTGPKIRAVMCHFHTQETGYTGKAMVRLELMADPSRQNVDSSSRKLRALGIRVLRFTEPLVYTGEGSEQTGMFVCPQAGELLQRRVRGTARPWNFPIQSQKQYAKEWREFIGHSVQDSQ